MRHLPEAWLRDARAVGGRGDVAAAGADLLARYAEKHRRYHGLGHLADVLRHVDDLAPAARHVEVVRLAAWFHDAVYDPTATDNEDRSARLAEVALIGLRVDSLVAAEVARLVRVTADHAPSADDPDAAVLCDTDLAVLASAPPAYGAYVDAVRAEYDHLDDATFARGRAEVLRSLLGRAHLFCTDVGRDRWEAAARRNLESELARLRDGAD